MFSNMLHHSGEPVRCCYEVCSSLVTLMVPAFVLAVIAAIICALVLTGGNPALLTSSFWGSR